jgi:8-oxo-dGTP diphosphatase
VEQHRVVAGILRSGDEVLLCHRAPNRRWYPSVWDFPGGHVEPGEPIRAALRRELGEEIGVDVGIVEGDAVLRVHRPESGLELTVWLITSWSGHPQNRQPDEHDAIAWFNANQLVDLDLADESYIELLRGLLSTA